MFGIFPSPAQKALHSLSTAKSCVKGLISCLGGKVYFTSLTQTSPTAISTASGTFIQGTAVAHDTCSQATSTWSVVLWVFLANLAVLLLSLLCVLLIWKKGLPRKCHKVVRKSLLEVRENRPTKVSGLALSPHAVDGSYCGHRLASIDEYISTLTLRNHSEISLKEVITVGLSAMDMDSLVPLLFFLPHEWKDANLLDTLLEQHPHMERVLTGAFVNYISPVVLASLADVSVGLELTTDHSQKLVWDMEENSLDDISDRNIGDLVPPPNARTRKSSTRAQLANHEFVSNSMLPMLYSGDNKTDPLLPSLPNPFVLSRDIPAIANKILQVSGYGEEGDTDPDVKQPQVGSSVNEKIFPGLMWGYHGLKYKQTPRERAVYRVFAAVLNRLGGNCVPTSVRLEIMGATHPPMDDSGSYCSSSENDNEPSSDIFSVKLYPTEKEWSESVEDLLKCLSKTHRIEFGTKAQATSFSKALSFKEKGEIVYIPLAIPYKTGIPNISDSTKQDSLLSYLPHCYFYVAVEGPLVNASVQAYQGVQGYNGWFADDCLDIPWQNSDSLICQCDVPAYTMKEGLLAARLCSLNACVHNLAGYRNSLRKGGYGSISTCIDSTAVIDMAIRRSTMLYPVLMSSTAKILLAKTAEELASLSQCHLYKKDFTKLRSVYLSIPSDIITQPQDIEDACARLLLAFPSGLPFRHSNEVVKRIQKCILASSDYTT